MLQITEQAPTAISHHPAASAADKVTDLSEPEQEILKKEKEKKEALKRYL